MSFSLNKIYSPTGDQPKAINQLVDGLNAGMQHQVLLGVTGSGKTFTVANVLAQINKPTIVLAHNKTLAAQLYQEYKNFFPNNAVRYFVSYYDYYQPEAYVPSSDVYIEKTASINEEIERHRLSAINALLTRKDVIVVASVSSIYNIGQPSEHQKLRFVLEVGKPLDGESITLEQLPRKLADIQYKRSDADLAPGTFQVKGDVVYIYPPYQEFAWRVEYWGDEVEAIKAVDPLTRNVVYTKKVIELFPAKEFSTEQATIINSLGDIRAELDKRVKQLEFLGKLVEAKRLQQRTNYDLSMLQNAGYCTGIENYSRYFDDREPGEPPYTLLDYFPKDYLMIVDESHIMLPQVRGMYRGDRSRKQTLIDYGFRLPSALDNRPLQFEEFEQKIAQALYTTATPSDWEKQKAIAEAKKHPNSKSPGVVEQIVRPTGLIDPEIIVKPAEGQITEILKIVNEEKKKGYRVIITAITKRLSEDLSRFLEEKGVLVNYLHSEIDTIGRVEILQALREGEYDVVVGVNLLREGIDLPEVSTVIILDADKQGFLRSKPSLIQLIGRAARNVDGQVVMFADNWQPNKWPAGMREAIEETQRRREIQIEYNRKYGITPKTISKSLQNDLLAESVHPHDREEDSAIDQLTAKWKAAEKKEYIKKLRKEMDLAAKSLEFETAARIRDKIKGLARK